MKLSAKAWIIGLCALLGVAAVATSAVVLVNKFGGASGVYTVKFELCTDLQTTAVNDREVEAGAFLEEPEVYVTGDNSENWQITGWYREKSYESEWDFDFDTVESDLTLYAKWEKNPQCTVNFWILNSDKAIHTVQIRKGLMTAPCDDKFIGREVLGYYTDKEMKNEFDFETEVNENLDLWVKLSDYIYFSPEAIMTMNMCGNQIEVTNYEVSRTLSADKQVVTITSKNGGYFWLKNLELDMNETSIIQIKAREVNNNYNGILSAFIMGNYKLNGEVGASGNFGEDYTGSMALGKSAEPDEEGYYTYTYNLASLSPGLVYDKMTGFRFGVAGTDKYTFEIKEIRTLVDEYAVSGEAFLASDGINFNALHLNTFSLMGGAQTEMIGKEVLSFGGPNGAYIYRKQLEIKLGEEQIVRVKAKGNLNGGAFAMFFFGDYTLNGKAGSTTDYTAEHRVNFTAESTDANGYTTYAADISSIPGMKYNTIRGLRLDLYGAGTRTLQLQSMISYAPSAQEKQIAADFNAKGIDFRGMHFTKFLDMNGATKNILPNGDLKFSGENGAFIHYKGLNIPLGDEQIIRLKAKGDLKGGAIALFFFGDYTMDGKKGSTTDYSAEQRLNFVPESTDKDGYTTYVADISSISGLKMDTIKGLRLDLYGEGSRSIDIQSMTSYALSDDDVQINEDFNSTKGIDFKGMHFGKFSVAGEAKTTLLNSGDFQFGGKNGAMIYYKSLNIKMGNEQIIRLKAKGDLKGGAIALFFFGDYTLNGKKGTTTDYTAEHRLNFVPESTDKNGYTIYVADISSLSGLKYNTIKGLRLDLYGEASRTIQIASMKSYEPSKDDEEVNEDFNATDGIHFKGMHFGKFTVGGEAKTELLKSGNFKFGGANGAMIHYKNLNIKMGDEQIIKLKAKGDLKGGAISFYLFGDYTLNGKKGTTTDYTAEHHANFSPVSTDKDGYTTYLLDISTLQKGLKYNTVKGLRLDLYGEGTRTIQIKSMDSEAPSKQDTEINEAFTGKGINWEGKHLAKFNVGTEVQATTKLLANGDFRLAGDNGVFIHKKGLENTLADDQMIEIKAKGDMTGRNITLHIFGKYTQDGVAGSIADYNQNGVKHQWTMDAGSTDSDGYTTYTVDLGAIKGLMYKEINGFRINIYGAGEGGIDIKSVKSIVPIEIPDEENPFKGTGLNLVGEDLAQFNAVNNPTVSVLANGDFSFGGENGVFIHKKGMEITLEDDQVIRMTAKGDLVGGAIKLFFFGDYTQDGVAGSKTDYAAEHSVAFEATGTDADGYTIYEANISSIAGLKYNTLHGMRIDLYGTGTRTLEIQSVQSVVPEEQPPVDPEEPPVEPEEPEEPEGNPFYLSAKDLNGFNKNAGATATLSADESVLQVIGVHGSFIHKKGLEFDELTSQTFELKAKASGATAIAIYWFGDYTQGGVEKASTDYGPHYGTMTAGAVDADGYTTYTLTIQDKYADVTFKTVKGFRIEMWNGGDMTLDIKEVKLGEAAEEPPVAPEEPEEPEVNYFVLTPEDLNGFNKVNAIGELTSAGDFKMTGTNGNFIHKKGLEYVVADSQMIEMKAKADLKGGAVAVYLFGDYTENGTAKSTTDYGPHYYTMVAGDVDADGYTSFTLDLTSKYAGVTWQTIKGYRIEVWGSSTMTLEIASVETVVEAEVVGNPFYLSAAVLNGFNKNAGAAATLSADESVLQMTGVHGSFIHKKGLEFDELDSQTIVMKAKASTGTVIALYWYGDYTEGGEEKATTDYGNHYNIMTAGAVDADGYTTYTMTIQDKYANVTYKTIKGFRIEVWNGGDMTLDIKEVGVEQ